ncbi:MAG: transposase [Nanoarchaeota archaeon]|nr:transposase [Nanoarchaeota archaeon]
MRNRDYKNFTKDHIYHLYNRGNNKEIIFRDEQDYRAFLFRLGLALGIKKEDLNKCEITKSLKSKIRVVGLKQNYFKLHAFCLMPNHLHLLIEQCGDESISSLLLKVFTSFSRYINSKHKRVGHVFQDQFKSVKIENNPQLMLISSYIHMNPVKDSVIDRPENYKWSSYADFIIDRDNPIIHTKFLTEIFGNKNNFIKENIRLYEKTVSKVPFEFLDMWCN